jgi:hypothetical protein
MDITDAFKLPGVREWHRRLKGRAEGVPFFLDKYHTPSRWLSLGLWIVSLLRQTRNKVDCLCDIVYT